MPGLSSVASGKRHQLPDKPHHPGTAAFQLIGDQPNTTGFSSSLHHWRKLVGVVFSGVRGSALSRPSFLAQAMSVMPSAIASDMPRSTKPALYVSNETRW